MKTWRRFLVMVTTIYLGFAFLSTSLQAQRIVTVDPGFGTLNEAIASDTTANGDRVDLNTIYELAKDGIYLTNGTIENRFPLHIRAAAGDGARPVVRPGVVSGGQSSRNFTPRDNLTLDGLYVTNKDVLGAVLSRIVRIRADEARIIINNCHLDSAGQSAFRLDNDEIKLYITNSIISNIAGDYNNGRGVDDRGNDIDSLVSINNTWYNISSRVLRDGGGFIRYARFDHNTIVNTGRRVTNFGETVELHFTNNMMVNHSFLGSSSDDPTPSVVVDSLTSASLAGMQQTINVQNNNFYTDPAFAAAYPDSVMAIPLFNGTALNYISENGAAGSIFGEAISFANGPLARAGAVTEYYEAGEDPEQALPDLDTDGEPFDFAYSDTTASFARSQTGQPLGDLNWFGIDIEDPRPFRIVSVAPGFGTLNEAIFGDTTATGERVDLNTIYELERGGIYLTNGTIENRFPVRIRAAMGDGERPVVRPGVVTGGQSSRNFTPRDDLYLDGLYVTNKDVLGGVLSRIVRIRADEARIVINDCHLDSAGQSAFRLDNDGIKLFVTNSIISNIAGDYNNGRGFDDRGNDIDSLVCVNNSWYNIASRVLRDGGGFINYAKFDHNTITNTGRRVTNFGEVVELVFTNNMMVNHSFLGSSGDTPTPAVNVDSLTSESLTGKTQSIYISNNNFYLDTAFTDQYPDSVAAIPLFSAAATNAIAKYGTGATVFDEAITFTNGPVARPDAVGAYYAAGEDPEQALPDLDTDGEPFDFGYDVSAAAYGRSDTQQPLGDLNWFGIDIVSDVGDGEFPDRIAGVPEVFDLRQNYPNPFNPSTVIEYALPESREVTLSVYNLLGQRIATLVDREQAAGTYQYRWFGTNDRGVPVVSGTYFYRIQAGDFVKTRKMLFIK